jgi:hypothetical protein
MLNARQGVRAVDLVEPPSVQGRNADGNGLAVLLERAITDESESESRLLDSRLLQQLPLRLPPISKRTSVHLADLDVGVDDNSDPFWLQAGALHDIQPELLDVVAPRVFLAADMNWRSELKTGPASVS